METRREHWDRVYETKASDSVSWYQPTPEPSLHLLDDIGVPITASLIDVGGGASTLVDTLLHRGWSATSPVLHGRQRKLGCDKRRIASSGCWPTWRSGILNGLMTSGTIGRCSTS